MWNLFYDKKTVHIMFIQTWENFLRIWRWCSLVLVQTAHVAVYTSWKMNKHSTLIHDHKVICLGKLNIFQKIFNLFFTWKINYFLYLANIFQFKYSQKYQEVFILGRNYMHVICASAYISVSFYSFILLPLEDHRLININKEIKRR